MDESPQHRDLRHLMGAAGRAHHAVYGGPNGQWPRWYAEWMYGELLRILDSKPSVDTVQAWLITADERQRSGEFEGSWPSNYADWFIEWDAEAAST
jgi:hypothetical protein